MRLTDKKAIMKLGILCTIAYMVSYITRINFGAVISEISTNMNIPRELLSMSVTGSFITYGTGQILSGLLGDKFSPKKLIGLGLVTTTLMNLFIPLCSSPYVMAGIWCINGFAQSLMWPPMVRLLTVYLSQRDYERVGLWTMYGSSVGTIFIYLVAPLMIALASWRLVFIFSAICGAIMLVVWLKTAPDAPVVKREKEKVEKGSMKALFAPAMVMVLISIFLHGMLKDGITTWMPSYIADTYDLANTISILTGVIIPVFTIFTSKFYSKLYTNYITNPVTCAGVIFGIGAVSALALYLTQGISAILTVVLTAMLICSMYGVNLMLICNVPAVFKKYGNVSTVSGVMNACTYAGAAVSTYGIAVLSERAGWSATVLMWVVFAVIGTVLCIGFAKKWKGIFD